MPDIGEYIPGLKGTIPPVTVAGVSMTDLGDIIDANGNEILEFDTAATAVNHIRILNAATTANPALKAVGDDTNVGLDLTSKGTGSVTLWTGDVARQVLIGVNTASAVNEITITPSATGNPVGLASSGDNTNVGLDLDGKGTGVIRLNQTATGNVTTPRAILSSSATGGIGYTTGAGGAVTQLTSKSTGATLNNIVGTVTMNGASLAADTTVSFVLTNSAIAANDVVVVVHDSVGTLGAYSFGCTPAAGSATIAVHNNTPAALAEAIVLRFAVIKGVVA